MQTQKSRTTAQKAWKFLGLLVAGICILIFLGLALLLQKLPGPSQIGRQLFQPSVPRSSSASTISEALVSPTAETASPPSAQSPAKTADPDRQKRVEALFFERFVERADPDTQVCGLLGNDSRAFADAREFGENLETQLLGESAMAPETEALLAPIAVTLRDPAVQELLRDVRESMSRGEDGIFQKAKFYAQIGRASASLLSRTEEIERVANQSYGLYVLAKAARLDPAIRQDPEVERSCREYEDAINRRLATNLNLDQLEGILKRHNIDPKSVEFDREMPNQVQIESSGMNLQLRVPWMERALKVQRPSSGVPSATPPSSTQSM
jgi:hypothetical protein